MDGVGNLLRAYRLSVYALRRITRTSAREFAGCPHRASCAMERHWSNFLRPSRSRFDWRYCSLPGCQRAVPGQLQRDRDWILNYPPQPVPWSELLQLRSRFVEALQDYGEGELRCWGEFLQHSQPPEFRDAER